LSAPVLKGPVRSVLWIHNAILKESRTFEEAVANLTLDEAPEVGPIFGQFKFFRRVLEFHEGGEDRDIFPVLEARYGHVADTYEFDHRRQKALYAEIETALQTLDQHGLVGHAQVVEDLQRQAVAFSTSVGLHVAKENELLYPLYDQTFSVEEQNEMNRKLMQENPPPPDLMAQVLPWMFRLQTPEDREGLARFFLAMFPPQGKPGLVQMLSSGVSPDEWADVTRRVPDLLT
jgi:hemerythrin-like domain-containing protein